MEFFLNIVKAFFNSQVYKIVLEISNKNVCTMNSCIGIKEGPEGVKWELGFAHFLAGKMGFHALGLGFINKKTIENGDGIKICARQT